MGNFVVSLDFELIWGVIDLPMLEGYKGNVRGVQQAIPRLLELADRYGIKLTFGVVGFLLFKNRKELEPYLPELRPSYLKPNISPYTYMKNTDVDNECHFAPDLVAMVRQHPQHELATHTFCHYYCMEAGQTIEEFEADLKCALKIAQEKGIDLKSLIFPRNQCKAEYLKICKGLGFTSYRGNETNMLHSENYEKVPEILKRMLRLIDTYLPITGSNSNTVEEMESDVIANIRASRFFRPYSNTLRIIEPLKMRRILKEMTKAAKKGNTYHLWWHPHNVGINQEENFAQIESIFRHYKRLNEEYGFESKTMNELANELKGNG